MMPLVSKCKIKAPCHTLISLNISARIVLVIIVVVEGIEIIQAIPHLLPKKKITPIAGK